MNWFKAKKEFNLGIVEGLNSRVNLVTRKSYGFKSYENLRYALFLNLGRLPDPEYAHRFFWRGDFWGGEMIHATPDQPIEDLTVALSTLALCPGRMLE